LVQRSKLKGLEYAERSFVHRAVSSYSVVAVAG
jgi:hypothetical protein